MMTSAIDARLSSFIALGRSNPEGASAFGFEDPVGNVGEHAHAASSSPGSLDEDIDVPSESHLRALVTFRSAALTIDEPGCSLHPVSRTVSSGLLSPGAIARLDRRSDVVLIELERGLFAQGDYVCPRAVIALPVGRASTSFTGRGVVIGIVDDGFDLGHRALRTCDGATRFEHVWFQTSDGASWGHPAPAPYGYGAHLDRTAIDDHLHTSSLAPYLQNDLPLRHGTRMAAIAGGTSDCAEYAGLAQGATFIAVGAVSSGPYAIGGSPYVADAIRFILDAAGSRPCVINLSIGDNLGPRDGTSGLERVIDEVVEEQNGRVVVVASGNAGKGCWQREGHLTGEAKVLINVAAGGTGFSFELWLDADDVDVTLRCECTGASIEAKAAHEARPEESHGVVMQFAAARWAPNGRLQMSGLVHETQPAAACGVWTLHLRSDSASEDRWRCALEQDPRVRILSSSDGRVASTVMTPATAENVIAVGAYTTSGQGHRVPAFSGAGPCEAGRTKPDIFAPGVNVGALSGLGAPITHPCRAYKSAMGTSVAAAITSGVCALELERSPRLSHRELRTRLLHNAALDLADHPSGRGRLRFLSPIETQSEKEFHEI